MTKNQCKNRITRLEGKIGEMQEQVIHYKRQVKVLDAEDSRRLLDKYHIESEELAELIYRAKQKEQKKPEKAKPEEDTGVALETPAESKSQHRERISQKAQGDQQINTQPDKPVTEAPAPEEPTPITPAPESRVNPLDMFKRQEA